MKFYQACYGKPGNAGWEMFNTSSDIPHTMAEDFSVIGSNCTPQKSNRSSSATQNSEPLFELIVKENAIYLLKTLYNNADVVGRESMFVHGYMFEAEGLLDNPNNLLSIADQNFKFDIEQTKTVPTELVMQQDLTIEKAMTKLGIDKTRMEELMGRIHILLQGGLNQPLYVVGKNDSESVRCAIFCILSALPYSLRYELPFSNAYSAVFDRQKSIIFVEQAPAGKNYFNLSTGDSNMDLGDIEYSPRDYATYLSYRQLDAADFARYCDSLSTICKKMNLPYNAYYEDTTAADLILRGTNKLENLTDGELNEYLINLMKSVPQQNLFIDEFFAEVLKIYDSRNLLAKDSIINWLEKRIDNSQSDKFVNIYKKMKLRVLLSKGTDEIVSFLNAIFAKSKEMFYDWCQSISEIEGGRDAVLLFFKKRFISRISFFDVRKTKEDAREYWEDAELRQVASSSIISIAKRMINENDVHHLDGETIINEVKHTYENLFGWEGAQLQRTAISEIKTHFWNRFNFADFKFNKACLQNSEIMNFDGNGRSDMAYGLIKLHKCASGFNNNTKGHRDIEQSLDEVEKLLPLVSSDTSNVIAAVHRFMLIVLKEHTHHMFCTWVKLALFGAPNSNPLGPMVRWKLDVLFDAEMFEKAFEESSRMKNMTDVILVWMQGPAGKTGLVSKLENNPELLKSIKHEIKILNDYKKSEISAQKAFEKEQKKLEKKQEKAKTVSSDTNIQENKKEAKDSKHNQHTVEDAPKKGGIFGGLFGKKK